MQKVTVKTRAPFTGASKPGKKMTVKLRPQGMKPGKPKTPGSRYA